MFAGSVMGYFQFRNILREFLVVLENGQKRRPANVYVRLIIYSEKLILVEKRLRSLWTNITPTRKTGLISKSG
jgi:hypothetical protein